MQGVNKCTFMVAASMNEGPWGCQHTGRWLPAPVWWSVTWKQPSPPPPPFFL